MRRWGYWLAGLSIWLALPCTAQTDCELVSNGSAPWRVYAEGGEVASSPFVSYGKAVSVAVVHRIMTGQYTTVTWDGGRIEGSDCDTIAGPVDPGTDPGEPPHGGDPAGALATVTVGDASVEYEAQWEASADRHNLKIRGATRQNFGDVASPYRFTLARAAAAATSTVAVEHWTNGTFDGETSLGVVTVPALDAGGPPPSTGGGGSAPPPAAGQHFVGDFSNAASDAELRSMVNITTPANVHAHPGVGMRYDFQADPGRCGDQSLAALVPLPPGTREVWMRFRIRFSPNWTTANPGCSSPSADYKTVLTWLRNRNTAGHKRFDLKIGQGVSNIHASAPGWPSNDVVSVGVVQRPGADALADGQWHDVEMHQALVGDNEAVFQLRIDGTVTHNYRTRTTSGLAGNSLSVINIGANRNLGATSLMHVWWDDFQIWVGSDPGGFNFPAPQVF